MKTVSLELANELEQVGFPQDSDFHWGLDSGNSVDIYPRDFGEWGEGVARLCAAPTADEILDLLPKRVSSDYELVYLEIYPLTSRKGWLINYVRNKHEVIYTPYAIEDAGSLADAAAKMWLLLKEKDLLVSTE